MQPSAPIERDIVLIGGGHAHVAVLKMFGMKPEPGVRVTLVARDIMTPYSGMLPGLLRDVYSHAECHIDLGKLARWSGAQLIRAAATGLDPVRQEVLFDGRPPLAYDFVSFDIGSTPPKANIAGAAEFALPIKPLDAFLARLEGLEGTLKSGDALAVIGAGAGGVETALAMRRRFQKNGIDLAVTLVGKSARLLPGHSPAVAKRMKQALDDAGIMTALGAGAEEVSADAVRLEDGRRIPATVTILATGASAPYWPVKSGLRTDEAGFITVNEYLQSPSHPEVFATGDCAHFQPNPLPKSGVYAVRQGPAIAENLRLAALGKSLKPWQPQSKTLALMSTGDGGAVVSYGGFAASGKWAWTWKDWIDRRWMQRYQELPLMPPPKPAKQADGALEIMRCGGCGAKVASPVLKRVLERLTLKTADGVDMGAGDDAAVLMPPPGQALVQTVDQFRTIVEDPYLFGEIATVHALSDLYAMGAAPHSALVTAILPHAGEAATERDLLQLLSGVANALDDAGAVLIGGHTGEGAELSLGLSVNGFASLDSLKRKDGARPGEALVLTKPLGVGVVMAGDMRGVADASDVEAALLQMRQSSARAAQILADGGASAMTDVTGFGLAGHLIEMADAGGVSFALDISAMPVISGAEALVEAGVESTMAPANAAFAERMSDPVDGARTRLLFDPQTSGGLAATVAADRAAEIVDQLKAAGYESAAVIGRVAEAGSRSETLKLV
jgi:selenide,water dikinase